MRKRQELAKEVQSRLAAGEGKDAIYRALKETYGASSVERSLAQWPGPDAKEKNKFLNVPLLIITTIFALVNLLQLVNGFQRFGSGELAKSVLLLLVQFYMVYGILNYNLISYLLVLLFGLNALLHIRSVSPATMMPLVLIVTAMVLAWIQKQRLFPRTSWFLRHKKDSDGQILF